MNNKKLYESHVSYSYEARMDKLIKRTQFINKYLVYIGLVAILLMLVAVYLQVTKNIDLIFVNILAVIFLLGFAIYSIYILDSSNPTNDKSLEIQLFIWFMYLLDKLNSNESYPLKENSRTYSKLAQIDHQISKRLWKLDDVLDNTFIFMGNSLIEIERYEKFKKALYHVDVSKSNKEQVEIYKEFISKITDLYVCSYSEKLAGTPNTDNNIALSIRCKKEELTSELNKLHGQIMLFNYEDAESSTSIFEKMRSPRTLKIMIVLLVFVLLVFLNGIQDQVILGKIGLFASVIGVGIALFTFAHKNE